MSVMSKPMQPSIIRGLMSNTPLVRLLAMVLRALLGLDMTIPAAEGGRDVMALAIALKLDGRGGSDTSILGDCRMVLIMSMKLSLSVSMGLDLRGAGAGGRTTEGRIRTSRPSKSNCDGKREWEIDV